MIFFAPDRRAGGRTEMHSVRPPAHIIPLTASLHPRSLSGYHPRGISLTVVPRSDSSTYAAAQAAQLLGVSERRVRQLVDEGRLPADRDDEGRLRLDRRKCSRRGPHMTTQPEPTYTLTETQLRSLIHGVVVGTRTRLAADQAEGVRRTSFADAVAHARQAQGASAEAEEAAWEDFLRPLRDYA